MPLTMSEQTILRQYCTLCSEPITVKLETESSRTVDQIVESLFRLFEIKERLGNDLEQTDIPGLFCHFCYDRAEKLQGLYRQLDAVTENINNIKLVIERVFKKGAGAGNSEGRGVGGDESGDIQPVRVLLRKYLDQKINGSPPPWEGHDFQLEETHIICDETAGEEPFTEQDLLEVTREVNLSSGSDVQTPEEINTSSAGSEVTSPRASPVLVIRVERLSQTTLDKYVKASPKQVGRKARGTRTTMRRVEEDPKSRLLCPHKNCKRKSGFLTEADLTCHIKKVHEGNHYPFACPDCPRKFSQPKMYETHLRTHKGDYPCYCQVCGHGFLNNFALKVHQVMHTGELLYKCDECPKAYKGHSGLIYHKRMEHTKEKPYTCHQCGKSFVKSDKLKRHIESVHATEKPLVCHLCGKRFAIRNYLWMHMRSHDGTSYKPRKRKKQLDGTSSTITDEDQQHNTSDIPGSECV